MLINHRHPLNDFSIDRYGLSGVNNDNVLLLQSLERYFDLDAVAIQPDKAWLLAEDIEQHLFGIVLGLLEELASETQAPGKNGAGENLAGCEAGNHHNGIEDIHPEALFLKKNLVGAFETRNDGVDENAGADRQQNGNQELAGCGQAKGCGGQCKIKIGRTLAGFFRFMKHLIEDFNQLMFLDLSAVVVNQNARGEI